MSSHDGAADAAELFKDQLDAFTDHLLKFIDQKISPHVSRLLTASSKTIMMTASIHGIPLLKLWNQRLLNRE